MRNDVMLLDSNTANQIAAGEVVEKPASVVKELIENALDAGATKIETVIEDGGIEYIKITDNGSGMSEANARLAILRHATSKIRTADDLLQVNTLGFRGEALPSIASVSKFSLLTREVDSDFATQITIDGGEKIDFISTGGAVGTTLIVEKLFYNVPARRKFLKTTATEGRYINEIVTKAALSRPDVSFKLTNNDKIVINTPGNDDLVDTIAAIYGKNVASELIPIEHMENEINISGYISKPTLLKGTRAWQTMFVNKRSINSRMVAKAIDHAYQSQIPKAGFPFAVLNITVLTNTIDINVHPQKSEIKFSDDSLVYRAVYHALINALTKPISAILEERSETPAFSYRTQPFQENIWKNEEITADLNKPKDSYYLSRGSQSVFEQSAMPLHVAQENLNNEDAGFSPPVINLYATDNGVEQMWPLGQIDRVFIVAQSEKSLFLIDQHAAHERILYDRLVKCHEEIPSQQFLVPLFIDATPQDIALVEEKREEFLKLGVDISSAGEDVLRISSLPSDIKDAEAESFLHDIFKMLSEMKNISPSDLRQNVLHYAACHGAIKAGELLNMRQMRSIIMELLNTEHPFTCPHGRPCMIEISSPELYKMFKRT